jgi:hypothetical protein
VKPIPLKSLLKVVNQRQEQENPLKKLHLHHFRIYDSFFIVSQLF